MKVTTTLDIELMEEGEGLQRRVQMLKCEPRVVLYMELLQVQQMHQAIHAMIGQPFGGGGWWW